jgi:hypothetical protein
LCLIVGAAHIFNGSENISSEIIDLIFVLV